MSLAFSEAMRSGKKADIKLLDAARKAAGPGRAFCLNGETLFEAVSQIESESEQFIQIAGMAGDRTIRLHCMPPDGWATLFYETSEEASYV